MKRGMIIAISVAILIMGISLYVSYKALDYRRHVNYFLEKYTNVVSEFSGRAKYSVENQKLAVDVPQPRRIVFMGDQIIEGWELDRYFKSYEAVNRGITGQRLAGFLMRLRPDVIELRPRAVVIQFSSYNFRPQGTVKEVQDYLISLAELCRCNGIEPILTTVIPVLQEHDTYSSDEYKPYAVSDTLANFNSWLREYCRANDYRLIDFNKTLANENGFLSENLCIDNTHLNRDGFDRLAPVTLDVLEELTNHHLSQGR